MIDVAITYLEQGEPLDPITVTLLSEAGVSINAVYEALKYIH